MRMLVDHRHRAGVPKNAAAGTYSIEKFDYAQRSVIAFGLSSAALRFDAR